MFSTKIRLGGCITMMAFFVVLFAFPGISFGQFQSSGRTENQMRVSSTIAPDKKTVSLIFDNLEVGFSGGQNGPGISTNQVSYWLPLEEHQDSYEITHDIRGHVFLDHGSRAILLVNVGERTETFEWLGGEEVDAEFNKLISTPVAAGSDLQISLYLLLKRNSKTGNSSGSLKIDSLDIVIQEKMAPRSTE